MVATGLRTTLIAIAILAVGAYVRADVPSELVACAQQPADGDRLACYDREVAKLLAESMTELPGGEGAATAGSAALTGTPTPAERDPQPDAATLVAEFGIEARHEQDRERLSELHAAIASIDTSSTGKRTFTLDNGQVWAEQSATRRLKLNEGDKIRIEPASLGSFRLFGNGKLSTRVERVR